MSSRSGSARISADTEALRSRLRIDEYERLLRAERDRFGRWDLARRTERRVAALLEPTHLWGSQLLPDRRRPRSRTANVDMIHIGPGGVLVIDVKAWREPRVEGGHLYNGDALEDDAVDSLLTIASLVEEVAGPLGLAPLQVVPVMVFAGRQQPHLTLCRVQLLGEAGLESWVMKRPPRLTEDQVQQLVDVLGDAFPPYDVPRLTEVRVLSPRPVLPRAAELYPDELMLFDPAELEAALIEALLAAPIEQWMTWLHPEQVKLVRQTRSGPARIRGPAGTGKTVVGLHRAAYLAATRPGRILYTSFVRTLPAVLSSLYARLSPETIDRVEFASLHRWAFALLRDRHIEPCCDMGRAKTLFNRAWLQVGQGGPLGAPDTHPDYWWEEISCVIKGRSLTDFDEYATLRRVGRRTPLRAEQRAAVWDLFVAYEQNLGGAGIRDLNDVLQLALDSVRSEPLDPPYAAVVVDEVQDLNKIGVELLHALVGDRPDGLLLIGDGQQAIYPGGFTLTEAGVNVAGRSTVLRVNYRNAAEILDIASAVVAAEQFDDLDDGEQAGIRDIHVARAGGLAIRVDQPDPILHDAALVTAIRQHHDDLGVRYGDMALLADTNWKANHYHRHLRAAGIPTVDLADYDGTTSERVKVGTFYRAKGLEFAHVYLPRLREDAAVDRLTEEAERTYRERLELAHRQLFVGMTRARDLLWLGYGATP